MLAYLTEYNYCDYSCYIGDPDDTASISSAASFFSAATPPNYPPPPPPPRVIQQNIKLPPFWNDAPVAWFVAAEAQFELRHVDSQKERFCHMTTALDKLSLKKIVHLVANPDPIRPYTKLKEALLASHVLTDFQRVELLLAVEPLGGRKPSELLADMWELCPPDSLRRPPGHCRLRRGATPGRRCGRHPAEGQTAV